MARRGIKTAIRVGGTAPLVLGALALDPSAALAATCDATADGSLHCKDETLGSVAVAVDDANAAVRVENEAVHTGAVVSPPNGAIYCYFCITIKGHPACLSGFDPVVDPWIEETVDRILHSSTG